MSSKALLYGMKRLIAVSAYHFLVTGVDRQIQRFKGDSAEEHFLGVGQYEGFADCPAVFPPYFQGARDRVGTSGPVGEGSRIGSCDGQPEFFTDVFINYQRPRAGIDQRLHGGLPDFMIFDYSRRNNGLINGIFERYFGMYN
jgi:hypothetical protein